MSETANRAQEASGEGSRARLDPRVFAEPPSEFWPGYFWFWNDRLSPHLVRAQLQDMCDRGARSVCPHPVPAAFSSAVGRMRPDYLTQEYLERHRHMVEEAARLGMNVWLYDEGGWPSGSACGKVVASDETLAAQVVCREEVKLAAGAEHTIAADALACFTRTPGGAWERRSTGEVVRAPPGSLTVHVYAVHRMRDLPDLLNPRTTQRFIGLTHEAYAKSVGEHLGNTIRWAFTDEPAVSRVRPGEQIPWTQGMQEIFRQEKGYDLLDHLPALFSPAGLSDATTGVRIDFFECWSRRFVKAYFEPLQAWCRSHGLLSGGHLANEDLSAGAAICGYGHVLRPYRAMDLPGIDVIWRQLWPGQQNHHFPKYASSVAHQQGLPFTYTESYCVYGNGLTPQQMKWLTDYQYVRGVNLLVGGCYPLSTSGHLMSGERPHFGPVNPLWQFLDIYHAYTARLSYALSRGSPDIHTAVYYPVQDLWAEGAAHTPDGVAIDTLAVRSHDAVARVLLEHQCDFDYIDDDALEESALQSPQGTLSVGSMRYDTVVVTATDYLPPASAQKLIDFARGGGTLVLVDRLPGLWPRMSGGFLGLANTDMTAISEARPYGEGSIVLTSANRVAEYVQPVVKIDPPHRDVRACQRLLENGAVCFLTNEGEETLSLCVRLATEGIAKVCDPVSGKISFLPARRRDGIVSLVLPPTGSCLMLIDDSLAMDEAGESIRPKADEGLGLATGWECRPLLSYDVGDEDFVRREVEDALWQSIRLGDWRAAVGQDFSGWVEYRIVFDCPEQVAAGAGWLSLGKVCYAASASLNGHDLGRRVWEPYVFRVSGILARGENELRLVVSNTLANQLTSDPVKRQWEAKEDRDWDHSFHRLALRFEAESRESGLFGPVRIY